MQHYHLHRRLLLLALAAITTISAQQRFCVRNFTFPSAVFTISVSGDSVFVGGNSTIIKQWSLSNRSFAFDYPTAAKVTTVHATSSHLYVGQQKNNSNIYRQRIGNETIERIYNFTGGFPRMVIVISPDLLYSGHSDGRLNLWQTNTGQNAYFQNTHPGFYAFSSLLGNYIYSFGTNGSIRQYAVVPFGYSATQVRWVVNVGTHLYAAVAAGGDLFTGGGSPFDIYRVNVEAENVTAVLSGHSGAINALATLGNYLFSGSSDRTIKQWQLSDNQLVRTFLTGHTGDIRALVAAGTFNLLSGSLDNTVKQWVIPELQYKGIIAPAGTLAFVTTSSTSPEKTTSSSGTTMFSTINISQISISSTISDGSIPTITDSSRRTVRSTTTTITTVTTTTTTTTTNTTTISSSTRMNSAEAQPYPSLLSAEMINYLVIGGSVVVVIACIGIFTVYKMRTLKAKSHGPTLAVQPITFGRSLQSLYNPAYGSTMQLGGNTAVLLPSTTTLYTSAEKLASKPLRFAGATSTLMNTKHQGLYVPGHYLLDPNLGLYRPLKRIYENRNCEVYYSQVINQELCHRSGSKYIAVKVMKRLGAAFIESFYQEVSLMYYFVGKPNFVQLVGFCNSPYQILTKYYSLGNLETALLKRQFISPTNRVIIKFSLQISRALAFMHQSGFAHADIKALNIFVDFDDKGEHQCYLGDFGLAQVLDDSHLVVKAYQVYNQKGLTVPYAAPELIWRFRSRNMTSWRADDFKRSDVYSFSILLYEITCGLAVWDRNGVK